MPDRSYRIDSIDVVRGLIMIVMALDHTRDFFGVVGISPTDVARASAPLFFTRWITHICAPVFFLLTGAGASLARGRRTHAARALVVHAQPLADRPRADGGPLSQ